MPIFRGKPACICLATWLPAYEAELLRRGVIVRAIDIYQLNGNAPASAGTHKGGAYDISQLSTEAIKVAREMGAAGFARPYNWNGKRGVAHQHGVLNGCPHNAAARYQIAALAKGFNGLGQGGVGGADTGPEPRRLRTWQEGVAWAVAQAPKELPPRVVKTREQLADDIAGFTAEIKRTRAARAVARKKREPLGVYNEAIAAMKRGRAAARVARRSLGQAPRR